MVAGMPPSIETDAQVLDADDVGPLVMPDLVA
jgi:hypothetical protein